MSTIAYRICFVLCCAISVTFAGQSTSQSSLEADVLYYQRQIKKYSWGLNDRLFMLNRIREKYKNTDADLTRIDKEIGAINAKKRLPAPAETKDLIHNGDELHIQVSPSSELSRTVTVDDEGSVALDLIGAVPVLNKTPAQAAEDIAARLSHFILNPRVRVTAKSIVVVKQEPPADTITVRLLGAFPHQGTYTLTRPALLTVVMAGSGGIADFKRLTVSIFRLDLVSGKRTSININLTGIIRGTIPDMPLQQDDIVWIPEKSTARSWISATLLPWGSVIMLGIIIGLVL